MQYAQVLEKAQAVRFTRKNLNLRVLDKVSLGQTPRYSKGSGRSPSGHYYWRYWTITSFNGRSEIGRYQHQQRSKLRDIYPEGI